MMGPFLGQSNNPHLLFFVKVTAGWRLGDPGLCPGFAPNSLYNADQLGVSSLSFSIKELLINTSTEQRED